MLLSLLLPWGLRRRFLEKQFGYQIHPTARIGLSWINPTRLIMDEKSRIDHLTLCKGLDLLHLKAHSMLGRGNWISGFPLGPSRHFAEETDRRPELIIGEHAAITHRHTIDCTNSITVGDFSTVAGLQSQLMTHSLDLDLSRQRSFPIRIGEYCFVGTNCVILGGSELPHHCVLGAKSLLAKKFEAPFYLYGGVPAEPVKALSPEMKYFLRKEGFVW